MNLFATERLGPGTVLQRGLALPLAGTLLDEVARITQAAPFRHLLTPGGQSMSVAMTNTGRLGWISDRRGYRYVAEDPQTGQPWPAMPESFRALAHSAAAAAGYAGFEPDACLVNRYVPGARMSLHQDRDEADFDQPIVSVSLGMTAMFQFGGLTRAAPSANIALEHGDVLVWGGEDRLRFHGVRVLRGAAHALLGEQRINLTFRRAA